jgi:hypothetical protein
MGGLYTENRSDKPSASVNARQKQADANYGGRADEVGRRLGITEEGCGFRTRLKEFSLTTTADESTYRPSAASQRCPATYTPSPS